MAFNIQNLTAFSNNAKTGVVPALWQYYNGDGDTITTEDYIPLWSGVRASDRIVVLTTTLTDAPKWYYATISSNKITLHACSETLASLDDVNISELADGDVLTYNGDDEHWENNASELRKEGKKWLLN